MSILKTGPSSKFTKLIKSGTTSLFQSNYASFLISKAKESFQKLKKAFCKELVLQHFDVSKLIRLETDISSKIIGDVLCQQDTNKNWHLVIYYLHKILPIERNYETHNAKLLAIVEDFQTWRHYFEGTVYTILMLINHNNLKKFMETTCLSNQ